ncbi:Pcc1-domain-containing protein [Myriangium duriaei CBS 260.36]|uniref:Pcc1-domain-containing protein n=1 Tax=Myriangium duriaei CBS 260.36 TaxID=1168546 RepID=A0A9P4J084_9PEZI|nr:Pcc1-domain-containing protein [Myriangium duriaei CBS 260.36]
MASVAADDDAFPCKLTIDIPLPTPRLASAVLRALSVDKELSPLVRRNFFLASAAGSAEQTVLRTRYSATTNRMLRVATNGFFESVSVALQVMQELDVDVLHEKGLEGLERVQGVEVGMEGETVAGG